MLTLIVGLAVIGAGLYGVFTTFNMVWLLLYVIGIGMVVIPLFQPLSGWKDIEIVNRYDLLPLTPNSNYYVMEDDKGNLMYRYKDREDKEIVQYSTLLNTDFSSGNIENKVVLREGKIKPKRTLWAFPIFCSSKIHYVIKFPEDKVETAILK